MPGVDNQHTAGSVLSTVRLFVPKTTNVERLVQGSCEQTTKWTSTMAFSACSSQYTGVPLPTLLQVGCLVQDS